jgi:hypothetical protein
MQNPGGKLNWLTDLFVKILMLGLSKVKRNVFWDNGILLKLKFNFLKKSFDIIYKSGFDSIIALNFEAIFNNIIEI